MNAPSRVGACWYRPQNHRRIHLQIAAQRWIAELVESGRITRGQKALLEELAKHADAKATTQKSIAFLAKRCGTTERTVQRYLRGLCPSKAKNPEAWAARVVTRRFIHAVPEPGRKPDNVPSWFTLEIPERFFAPKLAARRPPAPPARVASPLSPGGVENVTQAVIIGSDSSEISRSLRPSGDLPRARSNAETQRPLEPRGKAAPPPHPSPAGRASLVVSLCAQLFPSHAPIAHRAVARLAALGWTEGQIATYLRKASRDANLSPDRARHPLLTAVWLAEKQFRDPPKLAPPSRTVEPAEVEPKTPPEPADAPAQQRAAPRVDPALLSRIERARAALSAAEGRTGLKRPRSPADLPPNPAPGGGDDDDPKKRGPS